MKLNKRILNYSLWISLITILTFPGSAEDEKGIKYGFPISFLTYYHQDRWFIKGVSINILNYFINVGIIYILFLGLNEVYNRLSKRNIKHEKDGA